jgi:flavin reductase (DIM6/NTAB) family NADH-FMN oxidoreductase RutF
MKNKKITRKISQGMYVLTTMGGGCVVDALSQVSAGDEPLIAVAVMKTNYTNELIKKSELS